MRGVTLIALLSVVWRAHAKELMANQTAFAQEFMDKLVDELYDKLVDRALDAWPLHDADLDESTIAKAHPDKSYGSSYAMHSANMRLQNALMPMWTVFRTPAAVPMQTAYRIAQTRPRRAAHHRVSSQYGGQNWRPDSIRSMESDILTADKEFQEQDGDTGRIKISDDYQSSESPDYLKPKNFQNLIEDRLKQLGLTIPDAAAPAANYLPWTKVGSIVHISGQIPKRPDGSLMKGMSGMYHNYTVAEAKEAARLCGINLIAQMKEAAGGDLSIVRKIIKIEGFVQCTSDFTQHPEVLNGVSDLMVDVFGPEIGAHARFAVGCSSLPLGVAVEVGAVVDIGRGKFSGSVGSDDYKEAAQRADRFPDLPITMTSEFYDAYQFRQDKEAITEEAKKMPDLVWGSTHKDIKTSDLPSADDPIQPDDPSKVAPVWDRSQSTSHWYMGSDSGEYDRDVY